MAKSKRWARLLAGLTVVALVGAACGGDTDGGDGPSGLTGSVTISGSSTVQPISTAVAELFNETNPDVEIAVDGPGTGDGFELFCKGEIDLADASRAIEEAEATACADGGIEYTELEVALDGITVMVNSASPIECLTTEANTLSREVGGSGDMPAQDLEVTAPGEESGTYDAFLDLAGIEDSAIENGVAGDDAAALRGDYTSSPNDNVIIQAMEGSPNAVGFVGFAFAEGAGDAVKEVEVDAGDGCIAPTAETIADGSYPLSRSLFIYPNTTTAADSEGFKAYVDFYLTEEGLVNAVELAKYIPLPPERQDATRSAWKSALP